MWWYVCGRYMRLKYFHETSRARHSATSPTVWSQKTPLLNSLGTRPSYSVENPSLGATYA